MVEGLDALQEDLGQTVGIGLERSVRAVPLISIVVPVYNREQFIGATIDSVRSQTVAVWELVIFDDGSTDGTASVVEGYAAVDDRIRLVRGANGGVASARNRGFAATDAGTEFVIFLDSDDIWEPKTLQILSTELYAHPEYVSVHGLARCINVEGLPLAGDDLEERMRDRHAYRGRQLVPMRPDESVDFGALMYHNYVITPGIHLIRRAGLEQVGAFDPDTDPADDWDLAIRLSRVGTIGYVENVVLYWRRHDDTLTQSSPRWKAAYFKVRRKALIDQTNTTVQSSLARLGYLAGTRHSVQRAFSLLMKGKVRDAAREFVRTAERVARYAGIAMTMKVPRLLSQQRATPASDAFGRAKA